MKAADLDYELPPELIAQRPLARRDRSRLLVYERATGAVRHRRFDELPEELSPETLTVVNDTRVLPARLRLERPGGGGRGGGGGGGGAGGGGPPPAVHPGAAGRLRALPDCLRTKGGLGRRA